MPFWTEIFVIDIKYLCLQLCLIISLEKGKLLSSKIYRARASL